MIVASLLASVALAEPPNRTVRLWQVGDRTGGYVERLVTSDDGEIVVGRTRADGKAFLFDAERWSMHDFAGPGGETGCDVKGAAPIRVEGADWTHEVWLACGGGELVAYTWDGYAVERMVDEDGEALTISVDDQLEGVWWDPESQLLYAASFPGGGLAGRLHVADVFAQNGVLTDASVFPSFPKDLAGSQFNEAHVVDGYLIVSHTGESLSNIRLGSDSAQSIPNTFSTAFHCNDMAPSPWGGVYCVDNLGSVADYRPLTNLLTLLPLGVLDAPNAVCANPDLSDGWLAVTGNQVLVWRMDENGTLDTSQGPYYEGPADADNPIDDMATSDGYIWGGGIAGNLHIVTARPWSYPGELELAPGSGKAGTEVLFKFVFDQDVDWGVYLGGDRFGNGGILLESGSHLADAGSIAQLVVDDRFAEGPNDLYVIGTNDQGLTGHAVGTIVVDNPPKPPTLTNGSVQFDDGALVLTFEGIDDEDLQRYEIFVSEEPFDGSDFPEGGPAWDGSTSLKTPITVAASPSERVVKRIAPLENDVTYYIGVRAWDAEGKEGPMSRVVKGTPRPVFTAAELAGEQGGTPCSTGPASSAGAVVLALAALARRRRGRAIGAAALLAAATLLPSTGLAQARQDQDPWWRQDATSAHADFEIRYGVIDLVDEDIETVYDANAHNMLQMEFGPQFWRYVEADLGFGFFQELSYAVDPTSGASSGQRTMLTWYPLALDGTLRAHFLDEQPVVPFARYGWDYVMWSEKADDGFGGKDTLRGGKFGTHYALGANVLLDLFQPGRASFLEAQSGINDSWLTIEWRRQRVDARERPWSGRTESDAALDFSGDVFTMGLKLDW